MKLSTAPTAHHIYTSHSTQQKCHARTQHAHMHAHTNAETHSGGCIHTLGTAGNGKRE